MVEHLSQPPLLAKGPNDADRQRKDQAMAQITWDHALDFHKGKIHFTQASLRLYRFKMGKRETSKRIENMQI